MKVLLVGNYEYENSISMRIWANALHRELAQLGIDVQLITPRPILGRLKPSSAGLGKWLGYCDRFLIFPSRLRAAAAQADVVHICDHGCAMYALQLHGKPVLVTCHDMLAVRGALGEIPELRPSFWGRYLQRWIQKGLEHARLVACVSSFTLADARRILKHGDLRLVLNGLNYPFRILPPQEAERRLAHVRGINRPFVFHITSGQERKNGEGVLRIFARSVKRTDLQLVVAGQPLSPALLQLARELQVHDRIVQVLTPPVDVVEALYNRAVALLFPSRLEGFGWPSIEAQACGCPVVASDIPPLVEVLGASALVKPLDDEAGMADAIFRLATDREYREEIRRRGLANASSRFQISRMMDEYLSLYRELVGQACPGSASQPG